MPARPTSLVRLGRRQVLQLGLATASAGTVLALTGCRLRVGSPSPHHSGAPAAQTSTDERALGAALGRADALTALYAQAAVVRPDLADGLGLLGSDHTAHIRALQPLAGAATASGTPTASGTTTASGTATASGSPTAPAPLTVLTALSVLARAERAATTASLADLGLVSGPAARLLASVAACGAAHVAVLATLPATPPKAAK